MNGSQLETYKPTKLQDGQELQFGGLPTKYIVKMSQSSGALLWAANLHCCSPKHGAPRWAPHGLDAVRSQFNDLCVI